MTRADDIFTKLTGNVYFSKIDLAKGYWQIKMKPLDKHKTAFIVPELGCFQFKRMPFGLVNSAATFTRLMRKVLHGIKNVDCYIDDIVIHTSSWEEHLDVLKQVLERLHEAGLKVKASKCMFGDDQVEYVGHRIHAGKIGPEGRNVDKIRRAALPTTKKTLLSFVSLVNYYHNHIPGYASLIAPLTDLIRKGQPNTIDWTPENVKIFHKVKEIVGTEPFLQLPNFDKPFVLQVDASDLGIGAALLQDYDGTLMPVAFASRKLSPRERRFAVIEKECLAVIHGVKKFHRFLYGIRFVLQTDHLPLICLNQNRVANDRIMRWSLLLQPYTMRIEYIKGSENVIADFLSRAL